MCVPCTFLNRSTIYLTLCIIFHSSGKFRFYNANQNLYKLIAMKFHMINIRWGTMFCGEGYFFLDKNCLKFFSFDFIFWKYKAILTILFIFRESLLLEKLTVLAKLLTEFRKKIYECRKVKFFVVTSIFIFYKSIQHRISH